MRGEQFTMWRWLVHPAVTVAALLVGFFALMVLNSSDIHSRVVRAVIDPPRRMGLHPPMHAAVYEHGRWRMLGDERFPDTRHGDVAVVSCRYFARKHGRGFLAPVEWSVSQSILITPENRELTPAEEAGARATYVDWLSTAHRRIEPGPGLATADLQFTVPAWEGHFHNALILTCAALVLAGTAAWIVRGLTPAPRPGECPHCRYNLRGLRSARCPECGLLASEPVHK